MRSQIPQIDKGLTGTTPQDQTLQNKLVEQFGELHPEQRMKAFLGQDETEVFGGQVTTLSTMMAGEAIDYSVSDKREPPMLYVMPTGRQQTAVALQKWEGMVAFIKGDTFVARLKDLTLNVPEEEVDMSLRDVSDDDKELVKLGAIFYWSVGYETTVAGQIKRTSVIKFRRLPAWSERELGIAKRKAADAWRAIGWGQKDECSEAG